MVALQSPHIVTIPMREALLEAKVNTSWINRNEEYEAAVTRYVEAALDVERSRAFLEEGERWGDGPGLRARELACRAVASFLALDPGELPGGLRPDGDGSGFLLGSDRDREVRDRLPVR